MKFWLLCFSILLSCTSFATDQAGWRWVRVESISGKGWDVSQGPADVSIHGSEFTAKLFWQDSGDKVRIILAGTIKDGCIRATENIQECDYTGSTYQGRFERKKWDFDGTTGAESITLSDGWNMIGINRDLH